VAKSNVVEWHRMPLGGSEFATWWQKKCSVALNATMVANCKLKVAYNEYL